MILVLLLALLLVTIFLLGLIFSLKDKSESEKEEKSEAPAKEDVQQLSLLAPLGGRGSETTEAISKKRLLRPFGARNDVRRTAAKDSSLKDAILPQDSETEKLTAKLKKAREDYQRLEEELTLSKRDEAVARGELNKLKIGIEKDQDSSENYKKEAYELKEMLVEKDREYEKEFSLNINLNKELSEYKQSCDGLENTNRQYLEKLRLLEARDKAYEEELKQQGRIIAELNKKNEDNQWISRKEYDALKERLRELENGREKL